MFGFEKKEVGHPILLIVKSGFIASMMQKEVDEAQVYIISFGAVLGGRRFSAVINTVCLSDFHSEVEKMQFEQWIKETVPLKLPPGKKIFHIHRFPE